jgi:hypothetical protein
MATLFVTGNELPGRNEKGVVNKKCIFISSLSPSFDPFHFSYLLIYTVFSSWQALVS